VPSRPVDQLRGQLPWVAYGAIGVLAFACRLWPVVHGGGLKGADGYDDGVYYGAADAVVSGRVPYRDFVLLHPPLLPYLLVPFVALGRLIGDADGWAVARICFMAAGALSAVLVVRIASRYGRAAGLAGGLVYALWLPAIAAEHTTLLEVLPNTLLLLALAALGARRLASHPAYQLLAGVALSLATSIKIWGIVPLVVVVIWQWIVSGRASAARITAGAAAAGLVVWGPTLVLAPTQMYQMVVRAQLTRSGVKTNIIERFWYFTPLHWLLPAEHGLPQLLLFLALVAVGAVAAVLTWLVPGARIFVVLLLANGLVLLGSPPYFTHYGAFLAPPVALVAGVGTGRLLAQVRARGRAPTRAAAAAMTAAVAVLAYSVATAHFMTPFPAASIRAEVAGSRCVTADAPDALVLTDLMTRDLDRGCPTRIDVSGVTYDSDRMLTSGGTLMPRALNPLWQRDILGYLTSTPRSIVTRAGPDGFSLRSKAELALLKVLLHEDGVTVYAVPHAGARAVPLAVPRAR
jgi:alpha-1,2-mannosyltransferase